ncbi:LCP family glycopolymer transferase, partial [Gordonia sp. (in: high G+C Gram-positive bacteria)]
ERSERAQVSERRERSERAQVSERRERSERARVSERRERTEGYDRRERAEGYDRRERAEVPRRRERAGETRRAQPPVRGGTGGRVRRPGVEPRARRVDERRTDERRVDERRVDERRVDERGRIDPRRRDTEPPARGGDRIPVRSNEARREAPRRRPAGDDGSRDRGRRGDRRPAPTRLPGDPRDGNDLDVRRASGEIHTSPRRRAPERDEAPRHRIRRPANDSGVPRGTDAGTPSIAASSPPPAGVVGVVRTALRDRHNVARMMVALLSVTVLVCTGYAWHSISDLRESVTRLSGLGLGGGGDGATDVLLVGTDSRTDAKGNPLDAKELRWLRSGNDVATNTDTILLIRIPNNGSSATAISIPRDSYVEVPGIGMSKINAAYGATREHVRAAAVKAGKPEKEAETEGTKAGRKALIDTVSNLTGVRVDHYAEVGLLGFVLLTNAVGGVDVCLKHSVSEPLSGARFRAGAQTLTGPKALSFVRQRHDLPRGDLDRITRQQVFMASLAQKVLSAKTLTSPSKVSELQRAAARSIVIDDGWDIVSFVQQLKDLSGGNITFSTIPVITEHGWSEDGQQSVVQVDPAQVKEATGDLLKGKKKEKKTERGEYTVDITNAGTVDGLASNVSNVLTGKGYQRGSTATQGTEDLDSVILAHSQDDAGARQLAKDLGGLTIREDTSVPKKQLRVILTNSYAGPGSAADPVNEIAQPQRNGQDVNSAPGGNKSPITAETDGPVCVN